MNVRIFRNVRVYTYIDQPYTVHGPVREETMATDQPVQILYKYTPGGRKNGNIQKISQTMHGTLHYGLFRSEL